MGKRRGRVRGIAIAVLCVLVYGFVALVWHLLDDTGPNSIDIDANGNPDRPIVAIDVDSLRPQNGELSTSVTLIPGASLAGPDGRLRDNVALRIYPTASQADLTYKANTLPDTSHVTLAADGDEYQWPFDNYKVRDMQITLEVGAQHTEVIPQVLIDGSMSGWNVSSSGGDTPTVTVDRAWGIVIAGVLICGLLITIAGLALFVSIQTLRERRPFLPPVTTWFGAVLFAIIPLRGALPGSPPMGAWVDRLVFFWVLLCVIAAMSMYVRCWWRDTPPGPRG